MAGEKKEAVNADKQETEGPEVLEKQPCPFCNTDNVTLTEEEREIPYFGRVYLFSMTCSNCKFHKSDVESSDTKPASKYTIEVSGEEDMKIRVVKASTATVKIPFVASIEPGAASNGYVTNIEGILMRVKAQIESAAHDDEEGDNEKQARKLLKKINRTRMGSEKLKIIIDDPCGNSAIISDKAKKSVLSRNYFPSIKNLSV